MAMSGDLFLQLRRGSEGISVAISTEVPFGTLLGICYNVCR